MKKLWNLVTSLKRKAEAKYEGVPFRKKAWYNYRAMIPEDELQKKTFIEIFDEEGNYIHCPGIGGVVVLNNRGKRYRYRVVGFDNESRYKDWLYDTDYINPIIEYLGKEPA